MISLAWVRDEGGVVLWHQSVAPVDAQYLGRMSQRDAANKIREFGLLPDAVCRPVNLCVPGERHGCRKAQRVAARLGMRFSDGVMEGAGTREGTRMKARGLQVVVEVRGGCAEVVRKPRGIVVRIDDYDGEGGGSNRVNPSTQHVWTAQERVSVHREQGAVGEKVCDDGTMAVIG